MNIFDIKSDDLMIILQFVIRSIYRIIDQTPMPINNNQIYTIHGETTTNQAIYRYNVGSTGLTNKTKIFQLLSLFFLYFE